MSTAGRARAWLAVALAALLAGCTASVEPEPAASLPAGVSASLVQLRSDVAARDAQVRVVNDTSEPLTIRELRVDDPRFDGSATRANPRESVVRAGGAVDLRVALPAVTCSGADAAASRLFVEYTLGDRAGSADVPVAEAIPFLTALHERECRAHALAETVTLSFGSFTPAPSPAPAELRVELVPKDAGSAEISGIRATNLLAFPDSVERLPLDIRVTGGDAPVSVAVPLVPLRCDAHAVQEDRRGTVFTIETVLDGQPGQIELAASPELRGEILAWVADWCGFGAH